MSADAILYCEECESPAQRAVLGLIDDDGVLSDVDGLACPVCYFIKAFDWAIPVPKARIAIPPGLTAAEFFLDRLRERGCDPRPRRRPQGSA